MSSLPSDGRNRAPAEGPYAKLTPGGSRRRSPRADEGPALWELPRAAAGPELSPGDRFVSVLGDPQPDPIPPPLGAPLLILRADGLELQVDPVPPESDDVDRQWRVWTPGVAAVYVAELADPGDDGSADPAELRGLWCSCVTFAEHRDCGHLRDGVAVGLLRPHVPRGNAWGVQDWAYFDRYEPTDADPDAENRAVELAQRLAELAEGGAN